MFRRHFIATFALSAVFAGAARSGREQTIPLRTVAVEASSDSGVLSSIVGLRHLPDGHLLVSDCGKRRVILLDARLTGVSAVLDNAGGAAKRYGSACAGLIPYRNDSTVFVDRESNALIVMGPSGNVVRSMAPPKASDMIYLSGGQFTALPGFDSRGRVLYRSKRMLPPRPASARQAEPGSLVITALPDSAPIMRGDFDSRTVDTIAMIRIPASRSANILVAPGQYTTLSVLNPLPSADEWAVLPDGTLAIVRGQDYHIDWIRPDGARSATAKMPFDWKRITAEQKTAMLDSVRKAETDRRAQEPAPARGERDYRKDQVLTVDAKDLPDYYPPLRPGQVKSDADGNVWILPSTSTLSTAKNPGLVFDVVNRRGEIFERVRLPEGRTLAGFGPAGTVYMGYTTGAGRARLERGHVSK